MGSDASIGREGWDDIRGDGWDGISGDGYAVDLNPVSI